MRTRRDRPARPGPAQAPHRRMVGAGVRVLGVLGASYVLTCAILWATQGYFVYLPKHELEPVGSVLPSARDITYLNGEGEELHGWWVPASLTAVDGPVPTVVLFHGINSTRSDLAPFAASLSGAGDNVFLAEYRGFAECEGSPSEDGLRTDGVAAAEAAARTAGVGTGDLIIAGYSLGTGVATDVALARPPRAVVLIAPFTSLPAAAAAAHPGLPYQFLMRDRYDNEQAVRSIDAPTLVIAGTADTVVPFEQSRAVHDAARSPAPLVAIAGAGHIDPSLFGPQALSTIASLLASTRR